MADEERTFRYVDPSLISCDQHCGGEFAVRVGGDRIKQLGGITDSVRCVAPGAFTRGQHFGPPTREEHERNLRASRICTVYTTKANTASTPASGVDNQPPQA